MKNLKLKISISMISVTVILLLMTFYILNAYQQKFILDKASDALLLEASYFQDEDADYEPLLETDRLYDVNVLNLSDPYYDDYYYVEDDVYEYRYRRDAMFFKKRFDEGEIPENEIVKFENKKSYYYVLLIRVNEGELGEPIFYERVEVDDEESSDESLILLYVDTSVYSNMLNNLNVIFFLMLIILVVIEAFLGVFFGARLEDSQRKLGHFFQNASHELKTPLTSIKGYAEGIKTGVIEDCVMASDVIIRQSQNMQTLIDELLTISKLDSDDYKFKKEEVNLLSIIEESIEKYEELPEKKNIACDLSLDEEANYVIGDSLQIYKAVNTIIDNAFKYASSVVKIKTTHDSKYLTIDVYNDGSHISTNDLPHIFDRFYSGDNISTGIGLAMSKEIIHLSGGEISVNNLDGGVLFRLRLLRKK